MPEWTDLFYECKRLIVRVKKDWENARYREVLQQYPSYLT